MASFYATYSAASASGDTVTALQGTVPWLVAGTGTAGTANAGVVTVQGIAGGTAVPISGSITATNPSVSATGAAVPASATMIGGTDGGTLRAAAVSAAGALTVLLPTDASTATKQDAQSSLLSSISTDTSNIADDTASILTSTATVAGAVSAGIMQVNVATSNLPSGAATAARQDTGNSSLSAMSAKLPAALGQTTMAASMSVAIASNQSAIAVTQSTSPWIVAGGGTAGTAATGVVTIQGIASMTAVTTDQTASTTATFQDGAIAFGSLSGTYATVITAGGDLRNVSVRNNTNNVVIVSFDSGSSAAYTLDSGDALSLDLKSIGRRIASGTTLQAKHSGVAPTSGSIRINGVY